MCSSQARELPCYLSSDSSGGGDIKFNRIIEQTIQPDDTQPLGYKE